MKRIYIFLFYGHDKYANRTQTLYEQLQKNDGDRSFLVGIEGMEMDHATDGCQRLCPRTVVGQFGGFYVLLSLLEVRTTIDV